MDVKGKTVLITGAASGFGREIAVVLAERGIGRVILLDIDEAGLAETVRRVETLGAKALSRRTDVADLDDLAAAFAFAADQGYDLCFNNAGIVVGQPEYPHADLKRIQLLIQINVTAVLVGTQLAIQHLTPRGGGVIVNTGSTAATWGNLHDAPYRVSKAGIWHLTECCRSLKESANIRVCAFHPGGTNTPILAKLSNGEPDKPWVLERRKHFRILEVREVVEPAVDLALDDSRIENLVIPNPPREPAEG